MDKNFDDELTESPSIAFQNLNPSNMAAKAIRRISSIYEDDSGRTELESAGALALKGQEDVDEVTEEADNSDSPLVIPFDSVHANNQIDEVIFSLKNRKKSKRNGEKQKKSLAVNSEGVVKRRNPKSDKFPIPTEDSDLELA